MPAKPAWIGRIDQLERATDGKSQLHSSVIKDILGVSSRRAQQLISELPGEIAGRTILVDRQALLNKLRSITTGADNAFEAERRQRLAATIEGYRRERIAKPQLLVEAPTAVVNTRLSDLPEGVTIQPGRITVTETDGKRALEKLLALAMAIGNQFDEFDQTLKGQ